MRANLPRRLVIGALVFAVAGQAHARHGALPTTAIQGIDTRPLEDVPVLTLAPVDRDRLLAEDAASALKGPGPARFALPIEVMTTLDTDGAWETLADGSRLWRLRVQVPAATDLNFGFTRFSLPVGATLHILAEGHAEYEGPYVMADAFEGQLWTPVVPGGSAILELHVPAHAKSAPRLELSRVGGGYRDLLHVLDRGALPASGTCNIDVACPQGDPWRNEIASVALITSGSGFSCTGTMLMDVAGDFRPFFLTARHCRIDAASVVVYWNYQAATCGGPRDTQGTQSQAGAVLRATSDQSDFSLFELASAPDPAFGVYWAGWDRCDGIPPGSVTIHHPDGNFDSVSDKALAFSAVPLGKGDSCITGGIDTHWYVEEYSSGTTESGSSGCGLWDPSTHMLVGTLSGGLASCTSIPPDAWDCYGRFARHWTGPTGSTSAERLSDWLDPAGTGGCSVAGAFPVAGCTGQEISVADVRVGKAAAGAISIFFSGKQSTCATGEQVRVAFSARPAAPPGNFPFDPAFTNVTSQDRDPAPLVFRHVPPAFPGPLPATWYYQIVEALPGGQAGPSGSYGN